MIVVAGRWYTVVVTMGAFVVGIVEVEEIVAGGCWAVRIVGWVVWEEVGWGWIED